MCPLKVEFQLKIRFACWVKKIFSSAVRVLSKLIIPRDERSLINDPKIKFGFFKLE